MAGFEIGLLFHAAHQYFGLYIAFWSVEQIVKIYTIIVDSKVCSLAPSMILALGNAYTR